MSLKFTRGCNSANFCWIALSTEKKNLIELAITNDKYLCWREFSLGFNISFSREGGSIFLASITFAWITFWFSIWSDMPSEN